FILVDSAPGKGAIFNIYLPRISAEAEDGDPAPSREKTNRPRPAHESNEHDQDLELSAPDLGGHGTVLLVEDEDAVRVFAARALKNKGYKVLQARTGEQALDILRDTA